MKEAKANEPLSTIKFHQLTVLNFYTMPHFSENFKGSGSNVTEYVKPTKNHKIQEQKLLNNFLNSILHLLKTKLA
ncbi:hypothetical protein T02_5188 [Trichinella nativa]|uniref:Uncharacterized protein n=1 Tax=Trichinella nativa TaxID=6335 RepID=A0A0V1KU30_9BILA|nr:hypothetical protein T02_5188 [Trichinella nativa]